MSAPHPTRVKATIEKLTEGILPSIAQKYRDVHVYSYSRPFTPASGRRSSELSDPTGNLVASGELGLQTLDRTWDRLNALVEDAKSIEGELFAIVRGPGTGKNPEDDLLEAGEYAEAQARKEIRDLEEEVAETAVRLRTLKREVEIRRQRLVS